MSKSARYYKCVAWAVQAAFPILLKHVKSSRVKCAKATKNTEHRCNPAGRYLDIHMSYRYKTNTSVKRIISFGESNVVWGSPHGTCSVNSTFENSIYIFHIFLSLYWYSETIGYECMKQTGFVEKSTVLMRNKNWKYYHIGILDDTSQPRKQTWSKCGWSIDYIKQVSMSFDH